MDQAKGTDDNLSEIALYASARARLQRVRLTITMLLAAQMSLQATVKKGTRYNRAPAEGVFIAAMMSELHYSTNFRAAEIHW